jgi:tight adherence protein C
MAIPLLFGLISIAVAIGLGAYVVIGSRKVDPALPDGVAIASSGMAPRSPSTASSVVPSLFKRMASIAGKLTPSDYAQRLQGRLDRAGNPRGWTADRAQAFKGFGLVAGVILGALFGTKHGPVGLVLAPVVLGAFLFFLPDIMVNNRGQKRQLDLQKGLPDALDMMTVAVEAGLGFDAAMARVARNLEGPVAAEFARVLQEMQFGLSRIEALRSMVERTDLPELRRFVSAIVQSSELGISIGGVLREQSHEMRVLRRQRAEEKAQKLQVKILLPLITCLLPAMFIVILGPAAIKIMGFFHSVNH